MRNWVERLIYRKWFYGFLALVLWFDVWTDLAAVFERVTAREVLSLSLSLAAALLVTLIFVDLHWKWPPQGH
jgi:hypothetical protein